MIKDLITHIHPMLHTEARSVDEPNKLVDLVVNLRETMIARNGMGLSAVQIGLPWKVFVYGDPKNPDTIKSMFNAVVVGEDGGDYLAEEGCLSYPGLYVKIKRPIMVRIRYTDLLGNINTDKFSGMSSRIIQHEIDHGNGIVFLDRASKYHLEMGRKNYKLLQRKRKRYEKSKG